MGIEKGRFWTHPSFFNSRSISSSKVAEVHHDLVIYGLFLGVPLVQITAWRSIWTREADFLAFNRLFRLIRPSNPCLGQCQTQNETENDQFMLYSPKYRPSMSKQSLGEENSARVAKTSLIDTSPLLCCGGAVSIRICAIFFYLPIFLEMINFTLLRTVAVNTLWSREANFQKKKIEIASFIKF